jgi:FkbM family methyltransferase
LSDDPNDAPPRSNPRRRRRFARVARRLLPASARARLRRALFDWLQLTWTTRAGVQIRVATYSEWIIFNEIFVDGEYDPAIRRALDRLAPDRPLRVLDLGANVGFFTLRLFDRLRACGLDDARCVVTLVEADAAILPVLDERLHADNALASSTRVVHGAVGVRDGSAAFYRSPSPGEGTIARTTGGPSVAVPAVDLDEQLADAPAVDLVKCDIEGAELAFFEQCPALLARTAVLIVEIHTDRSPVARCRERLAAAGLTEESILRDRGGCALHLYTRE